MKATWEMIWALRRAAKRIINPKSGYYWPEPENCNCGILVQELTGLNKKELANTLDKAHKDPNCKYEWGPWSMNPFKVCSVTGTPIQTIWEILFAAGFENKDFEYIEFCGSLDWCFVNRSDGDVAAPYRNAQYVHDFFLKLADRLESKLTNGKPDQRHDDLIGQASVSDRRVRIKTAKPVKA